MKKLITFLFLIMVSSTLTAECYKICPSNETNRFSDKISKQDLLDLWSKQTSSSNQAVCFSKIKDSVFSVIFYSIDNNGNLSNPKPHSSNFTLTLDTTHQLDYRALDADRRIIIISMSAAFLDTDLDEQRALTLKGIKDLVFTSLDGSVRYGEYIGKEAVTHLPMEQF